MRKWYICYLRSVLRIKLRNNRLIVSCRFNSSRILELLFKYLFIFVRIIYDSSVQIHFLGKLIKWWCLIRSLNSDYFDLDRFCIIFRVRQVFFRIFFFFLNISYKWTKSILFMYLYDISSTYFFFIFVSTYRVIFLEF